MVRLPWSKQARGAAATRTHSLSDSPEDLVRPQRGPTPVAGVSVAGQEELAECEPGHETQQVPGLPQKLSRACEIEGATSAARTCSRQVSDLSALAAHCSDLFAYQPGHATHHHSALPLNVLWHQWAASSNRSAVWLPPTKPSGRLLPQTSPANTVDSAYAHHELPTPPPTGSHRSSAAPLQPRPLDQQEGLETASPQVADLSPKVP